MRNICSIEGCDRYVNGRGYCGMHYKRLTKHGDPFYVVPDVPRICTFGSCGSTKKVVAGLCSVHGGRLRRGKPLDEFRGVLEGTQEEQFWRKVAVTANPNRCWEWQRGKDKDGYGQAHFERQKGKAHIIAFRITGGTITPEQPFVLHSCDNPPCCNPRHLSAGTCAENNRQALERGRTIRNNGSFASPNQAVNQRKEVYFGASR